MKKCADEKPRIVSAVLPQNSRIIVISDVHGHYDYLKGLLNKVNFSDDDILVLNGDYIEKGSQSIPTLRLVMELSRKDNVFVLCGNCDRWRARAIKNSTAQELMEHIAVSVEEFGDCTFCEACRNLSLPYSTPEEIEYARKRIIEEYSAEIDFIRSLPNLLVTEKFIFVHGGLPTEDFSKFMDYGAHDFMKNDAFVEKNLSFSKYVVVGHWPTILYSRIRGVSSMNPYILKDRKIISEDGGCGVKSYGQVNALIIPDVNSEDFSFQSYDELETVTALENQAGKRAELFVTWPDRFIEVIEKGAEFSLVRHIEGGEVINIPNAYLHEDERPWMNDYCDAELKLEAGDKLSIILRTSERLYVKSHGLIGWYKGKYE